MAGLAPKKPLLPHFNRCLWSQGDSGRTWQRFNAISERKVVPSAVGLNWRTHSMSASGTKRTCSDAWRTAAFSSRRTLPAAIEGLYETLFYGNGRQEAELQIKAVADLNLPWNCLFAATRLVT
jgi:hypothetical protein